MAGRGGGGCIASGGSSDRVGNNLPPGESTVKCVGKGCQKTVTNAVSLMRYFASYSIDQSGQKSGEPEVRSLLRLLGVPRFEHMPDANFRLPAKAYVLLAALVLDYQQGVSRAEAATFLWSDADQRKAFANLRQLLVAIAKWEKLTGLPLVATSGRTIHPSSGILASDLCALLGAATPLTANDVKYVSSIGFHDLLGGIEVAESELARWIQGKRDSVRGRTADLLVSATEKIAVIELEYAFDQLAYHAPLDERVLRARMSNLAGLGNDAAALKLCADFSKRLDQELGARLELETRSLAARISARKIRHISIPATIPSEPGNVTAVSRSLPTVILIPPGPNALISKSDMAVAQSLITDVTLQLCRTRKFAMFAPHTARQLVLADPLSATAPYGLDYLVSTSIFPGQAPRLAFSLIRTSSQEILVADEIELRQERLLAAQATLSSVFASSISDGIASAELHHYRSTGAASAYVRFLLGSGLMHNTDLSVLRRSRRHLAQALRLAPDYVPALSAMARTLSIEWLLLGRTDRNLLHEAKRLAKHAVALDPLSALGHRELGHASMYLGDLDESEGHFEIALDRAPHHADILADRADILVHSSRMNEAKERIDQAILLNPLAPDEYRWISGSIEFFLLNYDAALGQLRAMNDHSMVNRLIAATAAMAGDLETARFHRDQWMARYPDFRLRDFASFMPHRSKADVDHFVTALAKAGFA